MSRAERRAMVERENPVLPISRQCRLLAVSRAAVYRQPAEVSAEDLAVMALIDRQYLARPDYGARRMAVWLATQGRIVNRKRVQRLPGRVAIDPQPAKQIRVDLVRRRLLARVRALIASGPTKCGVRTLLISRWPRASSTWS
jgi:putative transposase